MKALILAGGFGTRLQPVLKDLPKPLAPVNGKYFLEYIVSNLKRSGVDDLVFCLHYMADKIIDHFGDGRNFDIRISYSIEKTALGTGGAIGLLRKKLSEPFLVLNADTYLEMDIQDLIGQHQLQKAIATMAITKVSNTARYGNILLNSRGQVVSFCEKGNINAKEGFINAGLYLLEPGIFDYIAESCAVSLEKDVFPVMLKQDRTINTYSKVSNFFDIGVPEDYLGFREWMLAKR